MLTALLAPARRSAALLLTVMVLSPALAAVAAAPSEPAASDKQLPGPDKLKSDIELPDPFQMNDGSRVKTPADWGRRRAELTELILGYEYGRMPPAPGNVKATEEHWTPPASAKPKAAPANAPKAPPAELPAGAVEQQLKLTMGPENKASTHLILTRPAGKGPFPVIVKGDLCWGRVDPAIVADVVRRGYMLAEFDRTELAPDNADRTTGVYPLYPDYDWRDLSAWAWGFHRVTDYLLTRDDVDAKKVIVTGHSRGGKAALLAGALDERVSLTCPNGSGAGGAGCFRYQAAKSEDLARIVKTFPFWFAPGFDRFIDHVDRLPFDQHEVKALVAPRAYLSTEALGDLWANPEGTQVTHTAAREVFKFLGAEDRMGIHYREGKHEQNAEDFAALLDFADKVLLGKKTTTDFNRLPFPDAPKLYSWSATHPGKPPATAPAARADGGH
jgi:hypothetical protein